MEEEELEQCHRIMWDGLPKDIQTKAIVGLRSILSESDKYILRDWIRIYGIRWWCQHGWHFRGGMAIRNCLRTEVGILDDQLPSGNWDDYYIRVIEEAVKETTPTINEEAGTAYDDWDRF